MTAAEDVVLCFGPNGQYKLHIPMSDVENLRRAAYSFMEAGVALTLYADEKGLPEKEPEQAAQLLFDWAAAG